MTTITGFPQRLENLENENGHGILSILPLNFTAIVLLLAFRNSPLVQKVRIFSPFSQNVVNADFDQRDGHGKLRNGHGKVMEKILQSLWEP